MAVDTLQQSGPIGAPTRHRGIAVIIFVPCFAVLLAGGALARLVPAGWRGTRGNGFGHGSLFHEARTAAYDCVAFALMG